MNSYQERLGQSKIHRLNLTSTINSSNSEFPLVTVITIVLNAEKVLLKTMESVWSQNYNNLEYIIIDGGSNDGTIELTKRYSNKIDIWISENDGGPPDAVNKAIVLSSGVYVMWLPAGDTIEENYITTAVESLVSSKADFVFGSVTHTNTSHGKHIIQGDKNYLYGSIYNPCLNYVTWVIKRDCFHRIGLLDLSYPVTCDWEWGLRLRLHGGRGFYNENLNVQFLGGGLSENNFVISNFEKFSALRKNGYPLYFASCSLFFYLSRGLVKMILKFFFPKLIIKHITKSY